MCAGVGPDRWDGRIGGTMIIAMLIVALAGLFLAVIVEVFFPVHDANLD